MSKYKFWQIRPEAMTPVEVLQAATDKLDASPFRKPWKLQATVQDGTPLWFAGPLITTDLDAARLVIALHRTIDDQLMMLSAAAAYLSRGDADETLVAAEVSLAHAILGEAS